MRIALCFSKVMSASVPFFLTEVSLPQKLVVSNRFSSRSVGIADHSREEVRQLSVGGLGREAGDVDGVARRHGWVDGRLGDGGRRWKVRMKTNDAEAGYDDAISCPRCRSACGNAAHPPSSPAFIRCIAPLT